MSTHRKKMNTKKNLSHRSLVFIEMSVYICKLRINRISVDLFFFSPPFLAHWLVGSFCCYVIIIADRNKISCHLIRNTHTNAHFLCRKLRISCIVFFPESCFDLLSIGLTHFIVQTGPVCDKFHFVLTIVRIKKELITKQ